MSEWHEMQSAPLDGTRVKLRLEDGSEVEASFEGGFLDSDGNDCGCWVAFGACPDNWTDDVCWASNADEERSTWPMHWKPLAAGLHRIGERT